MNHLFLRGEINESTVAPLLDYLYNEDNTDDVVIHINTHGGYCAEGFELVDAIRNYSGVVFTYVSGKCYSMGVTVFTAGDVRLASELAMFMTHDESCDFSDENYSAVGLREKAQELELMAELSESVLDDSGVDIAANGYFNSRTAMEYGLVDDICSSLREYFSSNESD
jgi:ATP-dependent protease ClpP protease subunit